MSSIFHFKMKVVDTIHCAELRVPPSSGFDFHSRGLNLIRKHHYHLDMHLEFYHPAVNRITHLLKTSKIIRADDNHITKFKSWDFEK